jgi:hypothetical protein
MSDSLAARVDRLESIEAIRALKHTYCKYCDDDYDPESLTGLFWEDAVWDAGPHFGRFEGVEALRGLFVDLSKQIVWSRQLVTNARIEVDGDAGRGEFEVLQPCTFAGEQGERAAWLVGRYIETYKRKNSVWRFQSLVADIEFITPYEKGWHKAKSLDE